MQIFRTRVYQRKIKKLFYQEADVINIENEISENPIRWPIIPKSGGIRKARTARGASGKSSGARILYFYLSDEDIIYFFDAYAKSEKDNISAAEINVLKELLKQLSGEQND
jgi:hypothetical protein